MKSFQAHPTKVCVALAFAPWFVAYVVYKNSGTIIVTLVFLFYAIYLKTGLSNSSSSLTREEAKAKLVAFYKEHNRSKLASVDSLIAKYANRYDEMFAKLRRKYVLKKTDDAGDEDQVEASRETFTAPSSTSPVVQKARDAAREAQARRLAERLGKLHAS